MSNPIKPRPLNVIAQELAKAGFSKASQRLFIDTFTRIDKVLTDLGQVQSQASLTGRTEQLATTLQNVNTVGKLTSTDAIAADGTGSPLTGGKRGFVALGSDNRLVDSFRQKGVNVTSVPTSSTVLSNNGISHTISMAAYTAKFAAAPVSYNSASFDPGAFGNFFVFFNDPGFAGGAVVPFSSLLAEDQTTYEDTVIAGKINTSGGSATTGGGKTGGTTPGGAGGRGYIQQ